MSERPIPRQIYDKSYCWLNEDCIAGNHHEGDCRFPNWMPDAAIHDFVHWISVNAAYNGAPDPGQTFYNECLNAWLPEQAARYLAELRGDA